MGKVKRVKSSKFEVGKCGKGESLETQLTYNDSVRPPGRTKNRQRKDEEGYVDAKLSQRILEQAKKQQEELEDEYAVTSTVKSSPRGQTVSLGKSSAKNKLDSESDKDEEFSEPEDYYEDIDVDEDDAKALAMFLSKDPPTRRTLADIIQEKITEKQTEIQTQFSDAGSLQLDQLDERVINMYKNIRVILAKYRSGKLPKAFKIIPSLAHWEQILYLTDPEGWSAAAVYQATRIFASNLNAKMAQRFYNLVLLPRIRDDISEYKRLNFHLFQALKKSLFKPAAFFKGILLPLCESGTCTLREAIIVSSVLTRCSVPMLHSAAAILKMAEMTYTGANSVFLRALLDKKYALPYRVVDAVVFHFLGFTRDTRTMPVLWHQCLLTFAQRYKQDVSSDQKRALLDLIRVHSHHQISAEIRREFVQSKCRDEESETNIPADAMATD